MAHALRQELEQKFGPAIQLVRNQRRWSGYPRSTTETHRMVWEITRTIEYLPDDHAVTGWLLATTPEEAGPVLLGYQQLCEGLEHAAPAADVMAFARRALAGTSLGHACCCFAEWWYLQSARTPAHGCAG